jgi:phosphoglycolate phosphatase
MSQHITHLFFDFDGTLVDSLKIGFKHLQVAAEKYRFRKLRRYQDYQQLLSLSVPRILLSLRISPFVVRQIVAENQKYISEQLQTAALFPGVPDILPTLAKKYQLVIFSSNLSSAIRDYLVAKKLDMHFVDILGAENIPEKKKRMEKYMQQNQLNREQIVLIGDSIRDLRDGHKLGLTTVGVTYGIHPIEALEKEQPTQLVHSAYGIVDALVQIDR